MAHGAGWYFMAAGRKVWRRTKPELRKAAREIAATTGRTKFMFMEAAAAAQSAAKKAASRKTPAPKSRARADMSKSPRAQTATTMRRNPDPGSFLPVWEGQAKHRAARADFGKATKGRRIAASMKRRGGSPAETARAKTAKFLVDAKNSKNRYTLFRPSRRKADQLAEEFRLAGYDVAVREV